jgi:hypothetical protein
MWEKLEKVNEFGSDYFAHRRGDSSDAADECGQALISF